MHSSMRTPPARWFAAPSTRIGTTACALAGLGLGAVLAVQARAAPPVPAPRPPEVMVLRAARLIDGRGGAPLAPGMVRVEGEKIAAVAAALTVPAGARLIDLGDATLLPGFIDLHTHLTGRTDVHWEDELLRTTPAEAALWGAHSAIVTLRAGFTTVRDMGTVWPYTDVALRNAIEAGAVPGPRMLVAGAYVSSTGGAGDALQFSPYVQVPLAHNLADGPEEITKAVRTNFKNGADFIKILATGAVLSKGILPGAQQYSDEEMRAAVVEARRWGRDVAAHAHGTEGIKAAIRAGVHTIDHGSGLDDEAIAMLKARAGVTYYVPTLALMAVNLDDKQANVFPPAEMERMRQLRSMAEAGFRRALAAGIPIGLGTDVPVIPHGMNAREFRTRVGLGEKPMAALVSATRINSEIIHMQDRIGTIEVNKIADLVAVPGDPLADITVTERVGFVMKSGTIYRDDLVR